MEQNTGLVGEVKDHVIVFNDRSVRFITKVQHDALWQASHQSEAVRMKDGTVIYFRSISKMYPLEEYYRDYPDRRPTARPDYTYAGAGQDVVKRAAGGKVKTANLEALVYGLERYIAGPDYQGTEEPVKILNRMKARLAEQAIAEAIA